MKAAVFRGAGQIEVAELTTPEPGPGEVVVGVHYCGICGSDVEAYQTGMYAPGVVIGHEFAGEIVGVGDGVTGWAAGDVVTCEDGGPCGRCWYCRHGRPALCDELRLVGITFDGGMAEHVRLPVEFLRRVPASVTSRQAALAEPLSVALNAVRASALRTGDRALVIGAGTIGLLTLQCALVAGAREVYVSEVSPRRAALAAELGAAAVFNPLRDNLAAELAARTGRLGPDVVYVCTGAVAAYSDALSLVRRGGQVFIIGLCVEPVSTDFMSVVVGELDIRGGYLGCGAMPTAIDYIVQGRVRVEPLITHEIGLDDVAVQGFEALLSPETHAVKVLVKLREPGASRGIGGTP